MFLVLAKIPQQPHTFGARHWGNRYTSVSEHGQSSVTYETGLKWIEYPRLLSSSVFHAVRVVPSVDTGFECRDDGGRWIALAHKRIGAGGQRQFA